MSSTRQRSPRSWAGSGQVVKASEGEQVLVAEWTGWHRFQRASGATVEVLMFESQATLLPLDLKPVKPLEVRVALGPWGILPVRSRLYGSKAS